jgi:hypothetical protein
VVGCGRDEMRQHPYGLFEFLGEFLVFLVAPGVAEGVELGLQDGQVLSDVTSEVFQPAGEAP